MKKIYEKMKIYTILFIFGGALYCILELSYSGHTHFSMAICGGASLAFIYFINSRFREISIIKQAAICCIFITSSELLCGLIVNIVWGLDIWNYSALRWNFYGQICLVYSSLWFVLSLVSLYMCRVLKKYLE